MNKTTFVTPYWRVVGAVLWKDLRAEVRGRELVTSMLLFAAISVLIFSFALELDAQAQAEAVGGVLWVTVAYAGTLGLGRSLAAEKDKGSLDALLIAPITHSAVFFGKMLGNLIFTLVVAFVMTLMLTILFNINLFLPILWIVLLLGCLGFASTGTMVASMSVHARARETLLPIMLLPIVLPVIISSTRASIAVITDLKTEDWLPWLQLLAFVDGVFIVMAYLLYGYIVEE